MSLFAGKTLSELKELAKSKKIRVTKQNSQGKRVPLTQHELRQVLQKKSGLKPKTFLNIYESSYTIGDQNHVQQEIFDNEQTALKTARQHYQEWQSQAKSWGDEQSSFKATTLQVDPITGHKKVLKVVSPDIRQRPSKKYINVYKTLTFTQQTQQQQQVQQTFQTKQSAVQDAKEHYREWQNQAKSWSNESQTVYQVTTYEVDPITKQRKKIHIISPYH